LSRRILFGSRHAGTGINDRRDALHPPRPVPDFDGRVLSAHGAGGGYGVVVGGAIHDFSLNNMVIASKEI
jgi:hypothetical protein